MTSSIQHMSARTLDGQHRTEAMLLDIACALDDGALAQSQQYIGELC